MTPKPIDFTTQTLFDHLVNKYNKHNFELALALSRGLGWEIVGIEQNGAIMRAAVRTPESDIFDYRGQISAETFLEGYEDAAIVSFKLDADLNLRANRLIIENDITEAGKLAQSMWPMLPWKKDTSLQHLMNFLKDLERCSKHHGFWIEHTTNIITLNGTGYDLYITGNGEYRIKLS